MDPRKTYQEWELDRTGRSVVPQSMVTSFRTYSKSEYDTRREKEEAQQLAEAEKASTYTKTYVPHEELKRFSCTGLDGKSVGFSTHEKIAKSVWKKLKSSDGDPLLEEFKTAFLAAVEADKKSK